MTKPLVYVAGPITGNPWGCVRQATVAARQLRLAADVVPFLPQLSVLHEMVDPQPYEEWMAHGFDMVAHCQAVVRLDGESKGADRELAFAESIGVPVFAWPYERGAFRLWVARWEAEAEVLHEPKGYIATQPIGGGQ